MSDRPNIPETPAPEGITLHYMRDDEAQASAFTVRVPDAVLKAHPELVEMLPSAFMGSEPVAKRVSLFAGAIRVLEALAAKPTEGSAT